LALDRLSFLDYSLDFGDTLMGQIVAGARVELLPEQAVVGLDADCFRAESAESTPQPQAAVEVCFSSEEGILLSMHSQLTDPDLTFSIQAISVEHEVSDDDLSPPAPVEESSPAPASNR
jgi:hypothetical protein